MPEMKYDRDAVLAYAKKWALSRNPDYYDYTAIGGDCTNFASQCIYAGSGVMNFLPTYGWYYRNANNKSPSWTGVEFLHSFITTNKGTGPYGHNVEIKGVKPGDFLQLGNAGGRFYHSPVIVAIQGGEIFVAAHTNDAYMRPLSSYTYYQVRYIHIDGVRH